MIRLSTVTDSTFEPYTNICPIHPHEEIKIGGCGINLFDGEYSTNTAIGDDGKPYVNTGATIITNKIALNDDYTYIFNATKDGGSYFHCYDKAGNYLL